MTPSPPLPRVLVFDLPTRVFHGLLAVSFAGAFLTAESERWRDVHVILGYTVLVLVLFRLLWAAIGTRHARFAALRLSPRRALGYLRSMLARSPEHHAGHNPAGTFAIVALLGLALATTLAGLATYKDLGGEWVAELHEGVANAMLIVVGVHVAGVIVGSLVHRENLPLAMISGYKRGLPGEAIEGARAAVAVVLLVVVAGLWTGVLPTPGLDAGGALTEVTRGVAAPVHAAADDD